MSIDFIDLLRYPGVIEEAQIDQAGLQAEAMALLDQTLAEFVAAREREGANLAAVMRERLDGIERDRRAGSPVAAGDSRGAARQARPQAGRPEAAAGARSARAGSGAVTCRRSTSTKNSTASTSHVAEARRVFGLPEAVGRRLDFLMQEFNREANTLGSKSVDSRTTQAAVELKVLIEQLREQVQNLE